MKIENCPSCGNGSQDGQVVAAKGAKIICLECYMSWPVGMSHKSYYKARYKNPKPKAPSYVELWRENKTLKEDLAALDNKYRLLKLQLGAK